MMICLDQKEVEEWTRLHAATTGTAENRAPVSTDRIWLDGG